MERCQITGQRQGLRDTASQWVRAPDREFWYELFRAPPAATEADRVRRQRVARYALGAATVMGMLYTLSAVIIDAQVFRHLMWLNGGATVVLGFGMWMASLERHALAREILMLAVTLQMAGLLWLSGTALMISVFAPVIAALAWVLYGREAVVRRNLYLLVAGAAFAVGTTDLLPTATDFSSISPLLMDYTRAMNALVALIALLLILATFEKEVLTSEKALLEARQQSETLLHAVLPVTIARRLGAGEQTIADQHAGVSVLFADIAGFTPWSASQSPDAVVALLESIFSRFDRCLAATRAEKIKTIGDAYMAVCGVPDSCDDHAAELARLALAMMEEIRMVREETGIDVSLRIGLHSGPVVAGVIGLTRFSFDVWGDTVNTASRMESHGEPGRIQLSDDTRQLLGERAQCELRGDIDVKGRGVVRTWWLQGLQVD